MEGERSWREPGRIDWRKLTAALDHYESLGFEYIEVPWVVSDPPYRATLPPDRPATAISYGNLVGSGEQGFMELLQRGEVIGKTCTITPCFRDEETYDESHHAYFMKLELIDTDATDVNLCSMIGDALGFFQSYTNVEVIQVEDEMFDIVDKRRGIELGSYGYRTFNGQRFIYGTGIALPRLDSVLE